MAIKTDLLRLIRRVLEYLLKVIPPGRHVFVTSWPTTEGNGIETVRELLRRYDGTVVWADAPASEVLARVGLEPSSFSRRTKNSLPGIWSFLTAEASFFTHGVYGCPRPTADKPMINLWHGDGPKTYSGHLVPSTYVVSGSRVFGEYRARQFGVPVVDVILSGMPRVTELSQPMGASQTAELGIDPDRPFVIWMPTFRQAHGSGLNGKWADVADVSSDAAIRTGISPGLAVLIDQGIQVVVKPHPLDITSRHVDGVLSVTDDDLERVATTLYRLLGRAAGLITDYSSVWTDYLVLDRPIGFYLPDLDDYLATRGVYPPDSMDHLPGPSLKSVEDFAAYGRMVLGQDGEAGAHCRQAAREYFGLVREPEPARALLDALQRGGALRLKG